MTFSLLSACSLAVLAAASATTTTQSSAFFSETFDDIASGSFGRWVKSSNEKYASQAISILTTDGADAADQSLVLDQAAAHYGLSVAFDSPFEFKEQEELVVQYEVRLQDGLECGGAYMKLLDASISSNDLTDQSPYIVMFGPDKCGSEAKVHFIVRHQNPTTKNWEEKHLANAPRPPIDALSHLYTLVIRKDNTFEIFVDQKSVASASMLEAGVFEPAFTPAKVIPDPADVKPEDWIDAAEMDDPTAVKPDDWDEEAPASILDQDAVKPEGWLDNESEMIADPTAEQPQDWDNEDDGEWEAPLVENAKCAQVGCGEWKRPMKANPEYKGVWSAAKIPNPAYKGPWVPRDIDNPEYFEELQPARLQPIGGIALEVWTMNSGITFDNFWLGYDAEKAKEYGQATWAVKAAAQEELAQKADEAEKKKVKEALLEQGGFTNLFNAYTMDIKNMAQAQPILFGGVGALLLVLIVSFCSMKRKPDAEEEEDAGKSKKHDKEPSSPAKPAAKDDSDDGEKKVRQRKKAPKAE